MFGWLLPEILVAFGKVRVPVAMNFYSAIATALIASALVFF